MKCVLPLLPLLLVSCTPMRLVPTDFSVAQNNVQAYVDLDSVLVAIEHLGSKHDYHVFMLEVENRSQHPLLINLEQLKKYAHYQAFPDSISDRPGEEQLHAMTLPQIDSFFRDKEKGAESAAFLLLLIGAGISIYDAVQDDKDAAKSEWTQKDEKRARRRDAITSISVATTDVLSDALLYSAEHSRAERSYLPKEVFDRKVIAAGEQYRGKVLFKRNVSHRYHRIVWSVADKKCLFDFRKDKAKERQFLSPSPLLLD